MLNPAPRGPHAIQGIDIPTDASDVLGELQGGNLDFVARYYRDPASRWPTLSASEAQRLSSLGLNIVAVWESHSHDPRYFTYSSGYYDAMSAYRQARNIGQPISSAIYFAVDFDARDARLEPVTQYFRGIDAGMIAASGGRRDYRVGVYGSGTVCDTVKLAGLAQYAWLSNSTAWGGSVGYERWNIRQGGRLARLSFNHDGNEATSDYGGFRIAGAETAPTATIASSFQQPTAVSAPLTVNNAAVPAAMAAVAAQPQPDAGESAAAPVPAASGPSPDTVVSESTPERPSLLGSFLSAL